MEAVGMPRNLSAWLDLVICLVAMAALVAVIYVRRIDKGDAALLRRLKDLHRFLVVERVPPSAYPAARYPGRFR